MSGALPEMGPSSRRCWHDADAAAPLRCAPCLAQGAGNGLDGTRSPPHAAHSPHAPPGGGGPHEKSYAFVEFRSVEEASNAMALDGVNFRDSYLKVGGGGGECWLVPGLGVTAGSAWDGVWHWGGSWLEACKSGSWAIWGRCLMVVPAARGLWALAAAGSLRVEGTTHPDPQPQSPATLNCCRCGGRTTTT